MHQELIDHAAAHHEAAHVRRQPARILYHLQGADLPIGDHLILRHLILIKSLPLVTKRIVHVNVHLAVFSPPGILDAHPALEILRNVRARINVMLRFEQLEQRE